MMDAARQALAFVAGRRREDLDADVMLTFALVHSLQIVGEAAYHTTPEIRGRFPGVPWEDIAGMRHKLVHFTTT